MLYGQMGKCDFRSQSEIISELLGNCSFKSLAQIPCRFFHRRIIEYLSQRLSASVSGYARTPLDSLENCLSHLYALNTQIVLESFYLDSIPLWIAANCQQFCISFEVEKEATRGQCIMRVFTSSANVKLYPEDGFQSNCDFTCILRCRFQSNTGIRDE